MNFLSRNKDVFA
jgi:hypothetical protein